LIGKSAHSRLIKFTKRSTMDKKINILFLDHQAEMGGGEFSLLTLIKELNKEVFTPIVVLGTVGPFKDKLDASGINTKIIKVPDYFRRYKRDPSRKNNFFSLIKSLFILHKLVKKTEKIIKKNKAKVIVINTVKSAFFGIPAARRAAIKSVWVIRDCLSKDYYRKAFLRSIKSLSRKAGKIICTSQEVKAHLVKLAGNDLEDKINIVYNGADLKTPDEIILLHNGKCPKCGKKLSFIPINVEVKPA